MTINPSLLSPNKFKLAFVKFPDLQVWAQAVTLPELRMGVTRVATNLYHDYDEPSNKVELEDFVVKFLVNEDLSPWLQMRQWIIDWVSGVTPTNQRFTDMTVTILTNNSNPNTSFTVENCFPYYISNIDMDTAATEDNPIIGTVSFRYTGIRVSTP